MLDVLKGTICAPDMIKKCFMAVMSKEQDCVHN